MVRSEREGMHDALAFDHIDCCPYGWRRACRRNIAFCFHKVFDANTLCSFLDGAILTNLIK